jgi:hypothetical protein
LQQHKNKSVCFCQNFCILLFFDKSKRFVAVTCAHVPLKKIAKKLKSNDDTQLVGTILVLHGHEFLRRQATIQTSRLESSSSSVDHSIAAKSVLGKRGNRTSEHVRVEAERVVEEKRWGCEEKKFAAVEGYEEVCEPANATRNGFVAAATANQAISFSLSALINFIMRTPLLYPT